MSEASPPVDPDDAPGPRLSPDARLRIVLALIGLVVIAVLLTVFQDSMPWAPRETRPGAAYQVGETMRLDDVLIRISSSTQVPDAERDAIADLVELPEDPGLELRKVVTVFTPRSAEPRFNTVSSYDVVLQISDTDYAVPILYAFTTEPEDTGIDDIRAELERNVDGTVGLAGLAHRTGQPVALVSYYAIDRAAPFELVVVPRVPDGQLPEEHDSNAGQTLGQ